MGKYLLKRAAQSLLVLLVLSFVIFALMGLMPGDPFTEMISARPGIKMEDVERLKKKYGFDQPLHVRYFKWLAQVAQGNLEYSRAHKGWRTTELLKDRLGKTLLLTTSAFLLSVLISIPLGVLCAVKQYSPFDYLVSTLAFVGISVPSFWLGLMMLLLFAEKLQWFPPGGVTTTDAPSGGWGALLDRLHCLVLPTLVLAVQSIGAQTRYMRSSMLEVIRLDYIRNARAKGLPEATVICKHALRNALVPLVTLLALSIPGLFGGAVITETIFGWDGMGTLIKDSVLNQDYHVAMIALLLLAALTLAFNFIADWLYALVDPRIKTPAK